MDDFLSIASPSLSLWDEVPERKVWGQDVGP